MKKAILFFSMMLCMFSLYSEEVVYDQSNYINFNQTGINYYAGNYQAGLTLVIDKSISLEGSVTVPENITLKFLQGSEILIYNTQTLIINGGIEAGPFRIFNILGENLSFVKGHPKIEYAYAEWWGGASISNNDSYFDMYGELNPNVVLNTTKAIKRALEFYPVIHFLKGVYKHNGIRLTRNGIRLIGMGMANTYLHLANQDYSNSITYDHVISPTDGYNFFEIKNITIDGGNSVRHWKKSYQATSKSKHGIMIGNETTKAQYYAWKPTIKNVRVRDHGSNGIYLIEQMGALIENCYVSNNNGVGIALTSCNGSLIDNSTIRNNRSNNIYIRNGAGITVNNCNSENPELYIPGLGLSALVIDGTDNVNVTGGYYENCAKPLIFITGNASVNISGAFFTNGASNGKPNSIDCNIDIFWAKFVNITGCTFVGSNKEYSVVKNLSGYNNGLKLNFPENENLFQSGIKIYNNYGPCY